MRMLLVLVVMTWLVATGYAQAQNGMPVTNLTLQGAREITLRQHPRITAAELISLATRQTVREVRAAFWPVISADSTSVGTANPDNTRIAAGGLNNPLILDRNAEGVNVSQLIFDFGRSINLSASADYKARAEQANALATREQVLLELDNVYFNALAAQSVLSVATQTVATRKLLYDQVSELMKNKLRSGLDVSFAKVSLDQANMIVAGAQKDLRSSFASLSALLADPAEHVYQLADVPLPALNTNDSFALVEQALSHRPELAQRQYERDAALRFARAERDLHYPTISVLGSAGYIPTGDSRLNDNYAAAGINVSLPLFEGFLFSARAKEADLKAQAAREYLRDDENKIIRDVRVALLELNYASEQMTLTENLLQSASDAYELANERYKVGASSIVELSQAQLALTEAQIGRAKARYEFQIRNSVLNFQTGVIY